MIVGENSIRSFIRNRLLKEDVKGNIVIGFNEMRPKDFETFKNEGFKMRAHLGPLGRGIYARYK